MKFPTLFFLVAESDRRDALIIPHQSRESLLKFDSLLFSLLPVFLMLPYISELLQSIPRRTFQDPLPRCVCFIKRSLLCYQFNLA